MQTILIVDDDSSVLLSLSLVFKQTGYATRTAKSPAEAISCLKKEKIDLVLQDMNFSRQTTGNHYFLGLNLFGCGGYAGRSC
jgi:two-component system NtrC family response regulator